MSSRSRQFQLNKTCHEQGFTLIELMIVVGIIGILVAIAAPNFSRYQSKSRQSEAKIALSAIYGGEKSFYSEYSSYVGSLDAIGYAPEGQRRFYNVGWLGGGGQPDGFGGNYNSTPFYSPQNNPFTCTNTTHFIAASVPNVGANAQTFTAGAGGCIRDGQANSDRWSITDTKILRNYTIAL